MSKTAAGARACTICLPLYGPGVVAIAALSRTRVMLAPSRGHQRFADVVVQGGGAAVVGEVGFEEQLVVGVELPQDWQDALVRKEHLPDGLDPPRAWDRCR